METVVSLELAKVVVCSRWGDWQGHVSTQPWTGLTFHDIRFKGDRIAYELSLNDQVSSRLLPLSQWMDKSFQESLMALLVGEPVNSSNILLSLASFTQLTFLSLPQKARLLPRDKRTMPH